MDDSDNVERLVFFEQYLFKLKSEKAEFFNEIVERLLSQHLELPFVEDCRRLFVKPSRKPKKTGKVFGAPLNNYQLARIQPLVITIRDQIESEGIFRKPGSRARQKELRAQLDKGVTLPGIINVNDAGDLLKAFLRELPQPLLPPEHFLTHIAITDMVATDGTADKRRKINTLQALLLCLPDVNRRCLRLVLSLLYSVARSQDENKMTATSLATVFLPALLPQVLETGHDPEDRGKMNEHICFLIRHSRKILMPPVEIVHLVQKFYPEVATNMPPPLRHAGKRRHHMRPRSIAEVKDTIINFISPAKKRQKSRRKEIGSISHTLLFRSGSADWTSSPRALNREARSKSEKVLNRKSKLVDTERDAVSDDILLNNRDDGYSNTGSIASEISSAKSTDTLELLDMANNVDLFETGDELAETPGTSSEVGFTVSTADEEPDDHWCDSGNTIVRKMTSSSSMQCFNECLDESTMDEPEIHIGSVGDLLKLRQQEEEMQNRQREACRALARTLRASREGLASTLPATVRQIDENKQKPEEFEENKENRQSQYDNVAEVGMKRDSPSTATEPKRQKVFHTKEVKTSDLSPTVLVKMRGPKPPIKPKPSFTGSKTGTRSSRRDRLKRNSSTRMGPLGTMAISRSSKETIL